MDEFQEWVYTNPKGADSAARDWASVAIRRVYEPEVGGSGLEEYRPLRWYRQSHIRTPLHYFEYAIAQLGALLIWANAQEDAGAMVTRYRSALSLDQSPGSRSRAAG